MTSWLSTGWRWSWVVLLPLLAAFIFLASNTAQRYLSVSVNQLGTTYLRNLSLYETGEMEFRYQLHNLYLDVRRAFGLLPADELRNLQLFIGEPNLARLDSDLPASGFKYVPALMEYNGKLRRIKIRYRGDFHYHWAFYKKSLRIKTKKDQLYDGMRRFNLIVPKTAAQFNNYLSYALARSLGLTVPKNELVTLTINGKYSGLYLLAEQIDESTLRNNGLLPGDIYSGDQIYGNKLWYGIKRALFDYPGLWEKLAINNHYPEAHNIPIKQLLTILKQPQSDAKQAALENLIDLEAFARFNVMELFLNTHHHDTQHNWKIYFDPGTGKFSPLVWDPLGWYYSWLPGGKYDAWSGDDQPPLYVAASSLMHVLHKNGNFVRMREAIIKEFYRENKHTQLLQQLKNITQKLKPVIEKDPAMLTSQLELITAEEADIAMQHVADISNTIFSALQKTYTASNPGGIYQIMSGGKFGLQLTSHQVAQRLRVSLLAPPTRPLKVLVRYWDNEGEHRRDVSHRVSTNDGLVLDLPLISDYQWVEGSPIFNDFIRLGPGYYEMSLGDLQADNQITGIEVSWDGVSFHPLTQQAELAGSPFSRMTRVLPDDPDDRPLHWAGEIRLNETTRIRRKLIIAAGTRIILAPEVSLFVENQLQINGTTEQPVALVPAEPGRGPWGALVLEGQHASGSKLSNFSMSGGSGYRDDLREYSGMLSIHDVDGVSLDNCLLKDNRLVDDMMHVVYSSIAIDNCRFVNAKFDALDLDMSNVQITNSRIVRSGNDAVDLMGSFAYVTHNTLSDSGDKGVSVGERSMLYMTDNQITSNKMGVESKDDSIALVLGNEFSTNQQALNGYMKNWRYETGGRLIVCDNVFKANEKFLTLDRKSHTWISPPLTPDTEITKKVRSRVTENCDLRSDSGRFQNSEKIDYYGVDGDSYQPFLKTLYEITSKSGY
jgi:spore coat protein CotH